MAKSKTFLSFVSLEFLVYALSFFHFLSCELKAYARLFIRLSANSLQASAVLTVSCLVTIPTNSICNTPFHSPVYALSIDIEKHILVGFRRFGVSCDLSIILDHVNFICTSREGKIVVSSPLQCVEGKPYVYRVLKTTAKVTFYRFPILWNFQIRKFEHPSGLWRIWLSNTFFDWFGNRRRTLKSNTTRGPWRLYVLWFIIFFKI